MLQFQCRHVQRTTHIEGEFGNDEGTNTSKGGYLGVATLDEIEQRLKLVHDFDCFAFKETAGRASSSLKIRVRREDDGSGQRTDFLAGHVPPGFR